MTIYITAGLLLVGLVAYFFLKSKQKSSTADYFISTQSQSNERVKNLNLDTPSEDASYILDTTKLSFPAIKRQNAEYKANPDKDWVIDLLPVNGESFKKQELSKMFDYDWRSKFQSTIYGFSSEENGWTFADAGDSPDIYTKVQVAIDVQDIFNDENPNYDQNKLERYIVELEKRIKKYPIKLRLEHKESIESAIQKAKGLVNIYQEFNRDALIVLQSDKRFNGMEMWDALQSVGLKWGDGDLFHWRNDKDYGHDQHFSVWTTTEPGYFLPEEVKDGNMNPNNLVFGFSIPRSADPENVHEIMIIAIKYCQKRLGGQILDRDMQPLNVEMEREEIKELLREMENKGIKAGSEKALRMF
ncbi:MAG TPA: cell division protein ZipA C-terminal FtsZ-binding domain-containing protein [Cytophagales bacterium]|nr:cell division protein ZipA C-terminal FtsZ-binding domain-containing protein [Cytophagales bacterium]